MVPSPAGSQWAKGSCLDPGFVRAEERQVAVPGASPTRGMAALRVHCVFSSAVLSSSVQFLVFKAQSQTQVWSPVLLKVVMLS